MEIIGRKENPHLGRVEIEFVWEHPNESTPSLTKMIDNAAKSEPGSDKNLVFVKNVRTRFGMTKTSGLALIYDSAASASIEPEFVVARHKRSFDKEESDDSKSEGGAE